MKHNPNKGSFCLSTIMLLSDFTHKGTMGRCHLYGLEQSIWYTARWKILAQVQKVRIKIRICKVVKELAKREVAMG